MFLHAPLPLLHAALGWVALPICLLSTPCPKQPQKPLPLHSPSQFPQPPPSPRAKFICGSVEQLLAKPGGGAAWLRALREVPYEGEPAPAA